MSPLQKQALSLVLKELDNDVMDGLVAPRYLGVHGRAKVFFVFSVHSSCHGFAAVQGDHHNYNIEQITLR